MKLNDRSRSRYTLRLIGRALSFLLVAGITYSVSLGTIHSHGNFRGLNSVNTTVGNGPASFSPDSTLHGDSETTECLICVLYGQLGSSIVAETPPALQPPAAVVTEASPAVFYRTTPLISSPVAQRPGRAPPFAV